MSDAARKPKDSKRFDFRIVRSNGAKYLRLEDVAEYLRLLGSTEETDVRNRLNEAANLMEDMSDV